MSDWSPLKHDAYPHPRHSLAPRPRPQQCGYWGPSHGKGTTVRGALRNTSRQSFEDDSRCKRSLARTRTVCDKGRVIASRVLRNLFHMFRRFLRRRLRGAYSTWSDDFSTAPRSLLHLYRPFSGGSREPFSPAPTTHGRLRGGGQPWSRNRSLEFHSTRAKWTTAAVDFDSSISTALFTKAFEDVPPSMTATPGAKSFLQIATPDTVFDGSGVGTRGDDSSPAMSGFGSRRQPVALSGPALVSFKRG